MLVTRHLWIGNCPLGITESQLLREFEIFGEIDNVKLMPQRRFAFVDFRATSK